MNLVLKPYSEYQQTGLPWIGRCPAHWLLRRMKFLVTERIQKDFPNEPLLTATQSRGVIAKADYGVRTVEAQKDLHLLKLVEPGDYVISLRSFQGGIELAHARGIISPAYTILRPKAEVKRGYYEYFFKSPAFVNSMSLFVTGIREGQNIDYSRLGRAYMPLPPVDEQEKIGQFIRHLDHRVNKLIRAKKRQIELLNEQKQAIIHRAVTRGLDPDVAMKPSGVEWLGEIPAHWRTIAIKRLMERMDYGTSESSTEEGVIRVLTMAHIRDGKINVPACGGINSLPEALILKHNDLLFNRTNSPDLVGKVGIFRGDSSDQVSFASYLVRLRVRSGYSPIWLNYLLNSRGFWGFARSQALVSLHQANLNSTRYGQLLVPIPSYMEQNYIVDYLQEALSSFEITISKLQCEISFIREYRDRLVADVVTGQLDVRGIELPGLDQESEAPLGLDKIDDVDIADEEGETDEELAGAAV